RFLCDSASLVVKKAAGEGAAPHRLSPLFHLNSVDHTVAIGQQFPNVFVIELRDFSPEAWESRQHLRLVDDGSNHPGRVCGRILSDVFSNRFEVLYRAPRPDYSMSHLLRRASTSSWGKSAIRASVFYATAHFVQHIEMI